MPQDFRMRTLYGVPEGSTLDDWPITYDDRTGHYTDLGPGGQIAICDSNPGVPGLIGGGMLATEVIRLPIQFLGWRPPDVPRWGQGLKNFLRK
jgi:hypothetical protein